jgi:hypothetical protein
LLSIPGTDLVAGLDQPARTALARILLTLACGEESAIHVFYREGDRLARFDSGLVESQRIMYRIALEEEIHDALLRRVRAKLPVAPDAEPLRRKATEFYARLASTNPGLHFFRVSELDSAVCVILSSFLDPGCSVGNAPSLCKVATRIRSDEARHVLLARQHVAKWRLPISTRLDEAQSVRSSLIAFLETTANSFEAVGVDSSRLFRKILDRRTR